jgi:hypothetical protein
MKTVTLSQSTGTPFPTNPTRINVDTFILLASLTKVNRFVSRQEQHRERALAATSYASQYHRYDI